MILAIDYDDTYTRDYPFWQAFIKSSQKRGHTVYCVTWRYDREPVDPELTELVQVFYTNRKAKRPFMEDKGIAINIWIDDNPESILRDML